MKATRLVCILALAVSVAACGDSSDGNGGNGGTGGNGTGGTGGGTGGTGGALTDQCTNSADQSVYEDAGDGDAAAGRDVISDFASACTTPACGNELGTVVGNPSDENVQALADCIVDCTAEEYDLSDGCLSCYGDVVACGADLCLTVCIDATSQACADCLDTNCVPDFEICSGLQEEAN